MPRFQSAPPLTGRASAVPTPLFPHAAPVALSAMLMLSMSGCGSSAPTSANNTPDAPPVAASGRQIVNSLAPGQSGFVSSTGQAAGSGSGDPGDFGEHIDDQRALYWSFQQKPGDFADVSSLTPITPRPGVRIYRDDFGVPIIYADSAEDLGFGMGYALSQDRLFLNDAARRVAKGTLSELTGAGGVPADIQARVLGYTEAELQSFFDAFPPEAQALTTGYVAGANAWIDVVMTDSSLLPIEYTLLSSTPQPFVDTDVVASGVLITRSVASAGGDEMANVIALQELTDTYGEATARDIFTDMLWQNDANASVSIPAAEADFTNITTPPAQRAAAFAAMANFAVTIPAALATGDGTGDAPVPTGNPLGQEKRRATGDSVADVLDRNLRALFNSGERGGASYMAVIEPERSATGQAMLINGPQLGYGYPTQLMELEIHGAGFDARGSTAPLLPVVGIGYGERTAWGLTTGNSKTIDSFIETTIDGQPNQYLHAGQTKSMECRDEVVNYRQAPQGVPTGPAVFSVDVEVCRTVHGPVVARAPEDNRARSLQYAMWMRETETIVGVLDWMRVDTLAEFTTAMSQVTWNENTMYADVEGNIAYWHPGLHPRRANGGDQRFPLPGSGAFDHDGVLTFAETPQIINPDQGWLANWNNKAAQGWGDATGGFASSLPAGISARVTNWFDLLATDTNVTFAELQDMDRLIGIIDPRAREYVAILEDFAASATLNARQTELVNTIIGWDRYHHAADLNIDDEEATDTPGATVFQAFVDALRTTLFDGVLPDAFFNQLATMGNHEYDAAPLDNLAIRILDPSVSSITPAFDYLGGVTADVAILAALDAADAALQAEYSGTDIATYRRIHHRDDVCSLTGGATGPCITMPHQDRGSWLHIVAFE